MTLDSMQRKAHSNVIPIPDAADHYAMAYQRGRFAGTFDEHRRIVETIRSEGLHDYVWHNWKGDRELYDLIVSYIEQVSDEAVRHNMKPSPQGDRLQRSYNEADIN